MIKNKKEYADGKLVYSLVVNIVDVVVPKLYKDTTHYVLQYNTETPDITALIEKLNKTFSKSKVIEYDGKEYNLYCNAHLHDLDYVTTRWLIDGSLIDLEVELVYDNDVASAPTDINIFATGFVFMVYNDIVYDNPQGLMTLLDKANCRFKHSDVIQVEYNKRDITFHIYSHTKEYIETTRSQLCD